MNDEIKEYLDSANFKFKDVDEDGNEIELTLSEEIENLIDNNKRLADYITNLQQENDMLKQGVKDTYDTSQEMLAEKQQEINKLTAESTEWEERTYCWQDRAENLEIIIEKAIELINKRKNEVEDLWVEMKTKDYFEECDEIINILQNGSEE